MVPTETQMTPAVSVTAAQQIISRTVTLLERKFDDVLAAKPEAVDLNLSAVQIIDSAGLNWLLSMKSRLETLGTRLRLVDLSPVMVDALLATRLETRLGVGPGNTLQESGLIPAGGVHGSGNEAQVQAWRTAGYQRQADAGTD